MSFAPTWRQPISTDEFSSPRPGPSTPRYRGMSPLTARLPPQLRSHHAPDAAHRLFSPPLPQQQKQQDSKYDVSQLRLPTAATRSRSAVDLSPSFSVLQHPNLTALPSMPQTRTSRLRHRVSGYFSSAGRLLNPFSSSSPSSSPEGRPKSAAAVRPPALQGCGLAGSMSAPMLSNYYSSERRGPPPPRPQRPDRYYTTNPLDFGDSSYSIDEDEDDDDDEYPARQVQSPAPWDDNFRLAAADGRSLGLLPRVERLSTVALWPIPEIRVEDTEGGRVIRYAPLEPAVVAGKKAEIDTLFRDIEDWRVVRNSLALHTKAMVFAERPRYEPYQHKASDSDAETEMNMLDRRAFFFRDSQRCGEFSLDSNGSSGD